MGYQSSINNVLYTVAGLKKLNEKKSTPTPSKTPSNNNVQGIAPLKAPTKRPTRNYFVLARQRLDDKLKEKQTSKALTDMKKQIIRKNMEAKNNGK